MKIEGIMKMAEEMRLREQRRVLGIEDLVRLLYLQDQEKSIYFDFLGFRPTGKVDSYRGYYSDLAIEFSNGSDSDCTVGELAKVLDNAIGETYEGYKGGEYIMNEDTKVWVSNYGESSGTAIVGVRDDDWRVLLITEQED